MGDPNNGADQEQAVKDAVDDIYDDYKDNAEKEEEDKSQELELDEDKIVNSDNFEKEFISGIESVQKAAKFDREILLKKVYEAYEQQTGQQPNDQMIVDAFKSFIIKQKEEVSDAEQEEETQIETDAEESEQNENEMEEYEEYEEYEDYEEFEKEMNLALANVRELAAKHQ